MVSGNIRSIDNRSNIYEGVSNSPNACAIGHSNELCGAPHFRAKEIQVAAQAALAAGKEIKAATEKDNKTVEYKGSIDL